MAPTKAQQSRLLTVVQARDLNQGRVPPQGGKAGDSAQPLDTAKCGGEPRARRQSLCLPQAAQWGPSRESKVPHTSNGQQGKPVWT